ncbi:MAG TPA: MaoC family dehydratase N-terminal domain-containing protein [Amycolatopsis sp.]|nr:MaoC family dehydratase N-terminal domain-containing protein [Amycolatopsis sp.]
MARVRFPVEPGHVMAFARAVGAQDLAEAPPEPGTPVPATFAAVDVQFDPLHMRNMRPSGPLAAAEGVAGSVLHAEQHFEYLRPVRVGDVLTVGQAEGRTWEKPRRQGGRLRFREFIKEYRDSRDRLVVRSRMVLVETERAQR